jgi:hypothetical protein
VGLAKGEPFGSEFLRILLPNKIPAIVDAEPFEGDGTSLCLSPAGFCSISRRRPVDSCQQVSVLDSEGCSRLWTFGIIRRLSSPSGSVWR